MENFLRLSEELSIHMQKKKCMLKSQLLGFHAVAISICIAKRMIDEIN